MTLSDFFKKKNAVKIGIPLEPMGDFPLIKADDVAVEYDEKEKKVITLTDKLKNVGNGKVETDKTLSVEGAAADAKAVGDRINETLGDIQSVLDRI